MSTKEKGPDVKQGLVEELVETGEIERLKELLKRRLIEYGWRDEMTVYCKKELQKVGLENVTVDDLVRLMTARGRSTVPASVKNELVEQIRSYLKPNRD